MTKGALITISFIVFVVVIGIAHSSHILATDYLWFMYVIENAFDYFDMTFSVVQFRVKIYNANGMIADTECLCGMGIQGGKLGLFEFEQRDVIWSNIKYEAFSGMSGHAYAHWFSKHSVHTMCCDSSFCFALI